MPNRTSALMILVASLAGCITHYEANLAAAEGTTSGGGTVSGGGVLLVIDPQVRILSIDGVAPPGIPAEVRNGEFSQGRRIRLSPGTHRLVAGSAPYYVQGDVQSLYLPPSLDNDELTFDAVPGRSYRLKIQGINASSIRPSMANWRAVVVDRDGPRWDTVVSTTLARLPHTPSPTQ
jgi:hypothetical protein